MILKIENDYSTLITKDENVKDKIYHLLRFRQKNYYHTRAYQSNRWDGFVSFFSKKGKFLTGLLPEVILILKHLKAKYTLDDRRDTVNFSVDSVDSKFLPGLELYDYQVDLINQAIKHKRGIIQAPTGAGKTNMMIGIIKALPPNTPILILANRKTLVRQNYDEIKKWGFKVGRLYSDHHDPNIITCSTIQSAHLLEKVLPRFKVLIADEIHLLSNNSSIKIFKKLTKCCIRIAISATPYKFGGTDSVQKYTVKGYFGPIFKTKIVDSGILETKFLQDRENLSKSLCTFYHINEPNLPYDIFIDAVTNGIANNFHFHKITSTLAKRLTGRTLILVDRISHGDYLNRLLPQSIWISGEDNETTRKYVIEQLQVAKDNIIAIATRQIFDTGVNFKIHNLIDCTCIANEHGIKQLIGRGLRPASDKDILRYYGFIHNTNPYLLKHSKKKVRILNKEGHEIIIEDFSF